MSDKKLDVNEIMKRIPHRYPFLMVDRIVDYEKGKWIKAIKNVTYNEPFFMGHFPSQPIMPGVLMVEALAQAGGVLALMDTGYGSKFVFFLTIDKVKFRRPAFPGDQLNLYLEVLKISRGSIVKTHGTVTVDDKVVCEGDLMFSIMDKPE